MSNLDAALERTRSAAPSTLVQGHRFERMFRAAPRYTFGGESKRTTRGPLGTASLVDPSDASDEQGRFDNITDWCLDQFQQRYGDPAITKDDIWAYLYGVLHAPDWRDKYSSELLKDLPRIPFVADFRAPG